MSSELEIIALLSAWANTHLTATGCSTDNILTGLMEGETMKVLLEKLCGSAPKRLGSLQGLKMSQKVNRVDWFIDALKAKNKLPQSLKIDSSMFANFSTEHVYPVLWHLISLDAVLLWQVAPTFQSHSAHPRARIAEPLLAGPHCIAVKTNETSVYQSESGQKLSLGTSFRRGSAEMETEDILFNLVNSQLKTVPEGKKLSIEQLEDIVDSRVMCALVNSLVPGTFTSEVLLNDRWIINLAMDTATKIFRVDTKVDCLQLNEGNYMGTCAYLTYFFLSGYQFAQAQAVVERVNELKILLKDLQDKVPVAASREMKVSPRKNKHKKKEDKERKFREELEWLTNTYKLKECEQWLTAAAQAQAEARKLIIEQMNKRFAILTVPLNTRATTINDLCDSAFVNLSLTMGNGFYAVDSKESLWVGRRLVVRDKEKEEFYDDFSGVECPKGSIRELLGLHPTDMVEVVASKYPKYELFFESSSRNRMLKAGNRFLYQVFPGSPKQCERLLRQAAKTGDLRTVEKLILFFKASSSFVNSSDPETGNTAVHLAARHGHFRVALHVLVNGAEVNNQNISGSTPLFLAVEGLHKNLYHLLLEWEAQPNIKNRISKTAIEIIRNAEMREDLLSKHANYVQLAQKLRSGDTSYLESVIEQHASGTSLLASLVSRCVDGCTLFHWSATLGSLTATQMLLKEHVDPNITSSSGKTPLHLSRSLQLTQVLLDAGSDANTADKEQNTPLHSICSDLKSRDVAPDLVRLLVSAGADVTASNNKGRQAIHCAVAAGMETVCEVLLSSSSQLQETRDEDRSREVGSEEPSSLICISLMNYHLSCAKWLSDRNFSLRRGEAEKLALKFFQLETSQNCNETLEIVSFLLAHGLDIGTCNANNQSLLHLAASRTDQPKLGDLLLDAGAEVDARNKSGKTPLFVCCQQNNFYLASRLIKLGADVNCKDDSGKAGFDYIADHKEWMESGFFTETTQAQLNVYSLKHARLLVRSITEKVIGRTQ